MTGETLRDALTRRGMIQSATAAAAVASLPASVIARPAARRPNILFILADDLGYADLGCYGARAYKTPVLDRLAADGLLMTDGYSNSPVCTPTRVALITGRYQYRLRAGLEEPLTRIDAALGLPPPHSTLPSLLKAGGYTTALVGKWHMGWPTAFGPLKSGYDRFFGFIGPQINYFTHKTAGRFTVEAARTGADNLANDQFEALYDGETIVDRPGYLTDLLADRAIAEIEAGVAAKRPFFVSLHFNAPHSPWQAPSGASAATSPAIHDGSIETYASMVVALDRAIGRVLAALAASGTAADTIVVFTSDNGGDRYSDIWPFSGRKGKLLEGGIRVPLLVRWPRRIKAGRRSAQAMTSMDWLPTLLAAAGAAPDAHTPPDGLNLLDVVVGAAPPAERKLYWRFKTDDQAALRDGKWKYLRRRGREYLFDLAADPRERVNLKERHADTFTRLKQDHAAWNATMPPYPEDSFSMGAVAANALADD